MRHFYKDDISHPMSGMFDDLLKDIKSEGNTLVKKFTSGEVVKTAVADQTASLLQKLAMNPQVQKKAAEEAEKAVLEKTVSSLQAQRRQLMADISELSKNPWKFAQANPVKAAMYFGIPTALIFWFFWRRKKRK